MAKLHNGFLEKEFTLLTESSLKYKAQELNLDPMNEPNAIVDVIYGSELLKRDDVVKSFNNMAITEEHEGNFIDPEKRFYIKGLVTNTWYDEKEKAIKGRAVFTDSELIEKIEKKEKTEVSGGWTLSVSKVKDGVYKAIEIVGNHVSIVANGRGGEACSVVNSMTAGGKIIVTGGIQMKTKVKNENTVDDKDDKDKKDETKNEDTVKDEKDETKTENEGEGEPSVEDRLSVLEEGFSTMNEKLDKLLGNQETSNEDTTDDEDKEKGDEKKTTNSNSLKAADVKKIVTETLNSILGKDKIEVINQMSEYNKAMVQNANQVLNQQAIDKKNEDDVFNSFYKGVKK